MDYLNEPLQRCDKNALVGIVKNLCVYFQDVLQSYVEEPEDEENNGELNRQRDCENHYSGSIV
jgi:hypothetical protein